MAELYTIRLYIRTDKWCLRFSDSEVFCNYIIWCDVYRKVWHTQILAMCARSANVMTCFHLFTHFSAAHMCQVVDFSHAFQIIYSSIYRIVKYYYYYIMLRTAFQCVLYFRRLYIQKKIYFSKNQPFYTHPIWTHFTLWWCHCSCAAREHKLPDYYGSCFATTSLMSKFVLCVRTYIAHL